MSSVTVAPAPGAIGVLPDKPVSRVRKKLTNPVASLVAVVIGIIWTVPTVGLLVSSIRPRLVPNLVNSFVIVIPATIIPITVASLAAYGLIWTKVKGRDWLFIAIFALQIVPLQLAVIPLLNLFTNGWHLGSTTVIPDFGIGGHAAAIWIAHSCFGLPLIIFLLHNFMSEVPGDIVEAARIDGAGHGQIYRQIMLPLLTPAIAAISIFQFLWVWNDLFVGLIMGGGNPDINPITVKVQGLVSSSSGGGTELLPAAAFLSIIIPLVVFLALQRYFVRGLLAG